MAQIKYKESVYEYIRDGEILVGTAPELSERTGVAIANLQRYTVLIGTRHAKIRATKHSTGEVIYGTLDELEAATGYHFSTMQRAIDKGDGNAKLWNFSLTGQYIVDYIRVPTPKPVKPKSSYTSVKPVYVNKREPMSDYGKYLLAQSFKGWGEAK